MTHALHKLKHLLGKKWQMCCINQEKQYFKRYVAKSFKVANALLEHLLRKKSNVLQKTGDRRNDLKVIVMHLPL